MKDIGLALLILLIIVTAVAPVAAQSASTDDIQPVNLLETPEESPDTADTEPVTVDLTPVIRERETPEAPEPAATTVSSDESTPTLRTATEVETEEPVIRPEDRQPALTVEEVIEEIKEAEAKEPAPEPKSYVIPTSFGDTGGPAFVGHRSVLDRYAGWGWIKKDGASWNSSQWSVIEEIPNDMPAPGRFLKHPNDDDNFQYRLYGEWADYKAYEPNYDVFVPVFKLTGFELIGKAGKPSGLRPPRGTSMTGRSGAVPGGGGARNNPFDR